VTKTELGSAALVIAVKAEVINIRTLRQHCNVAKYEANCSLTNVISLSGSSREGPYVVAANTAADLLLNVRLLHGLANYIDRRLMLLFVVHIRHLSAVATSGLSVNAVFKQPPSGFQHNWRKHILYRPVKVRIIDVKNVYYVFLFRARFLTFFIFPAFFIFKNVH